MTYKAEYTTLAFASATDKYIPENAKQCEEMGLRYTIGGNNIAAGWFLFECEWHTDWMRDYNPHYESKKLVAGPFTSKEEALAYIM